MGRKEKIISEEDPNYSPYERKKMRKNAKKIDLAFNSFIWTNEEEKLYLEYLEKNNSAFKNMEQRKKNKVFVFMSAHIKIRGPDQCRSHHQKMCKKYGSIESIIQGIRQQKLSKDEMDCPQENLKQNTLMMGKTTFEIEVINDSKEQNQCQFEEIIVTPSEMQEEGAQIWDLVDHNVWIQL